MNYTIIPLMVIYGFPVIIRGFMTLSFFGFVLYFANEELTNGSSAAASIGYGIVKGAVWPLTILIRLISH